MKSEELTLRQELGELGSILRQELGQLGSAFGHELKELGLLAGAYIAYGALGGVVSSAVMSRDIEKSSDNVKQAMLYSAGEAYNDSYELGRF